MDSFLIERKTFLILFSKQLADTSGLKSGTDKGMLVEVDLVRCDLQLS